jgi:Biotin-lipoyl like
MKQLFLLRTLVQPDRFGRVLLVLMSLTMASVFAQTRPQVNVAAVQLKAVGSGFELDGVVQAVKQGTVSAQASGRLVALAVKAGDPVRAGQLLATIDDRETQTGVQRSRAQVAQAQAAPVSCWPRVLSARLPWTQPMPSSNRRKRGVIKPARVKNNPACRRVLPG